jgi:hypothetical protein
MNEIKQKVIMKFGIQATYLYFDHRQRLQPTYVVSKTGRLSMTPKSLFVNISVRIIMRGRSAAICCCQVAAWFPTCEKSQNC